MPTVNIDHIPASPNHASVPKRTQQPIALLLNGPAQVASNQLLKAKLFYWSIIASASPAPPAPRRALPVANRLRACPPAQRPQQPLRAVTAAQSTIWTLAAAARAHGLPSQVSKFLRQGRDVCRRGLAGGLPLAPFAAIPADLVGDHEPRLGRRASATGSGCPGAVGFQVVGVVLLPCIDDVQDRGIDHHRRERLAARYRVRGKRVFRAISSQMCASSARSIEFSPMRLSLPAGQPLMHIHMHGWRLIAF